MPNVLHAVGFFAFAAPVAADIHNMAIGTMPERANGKS
jgi:hypothetical protein